MLRIVRYKICNWWLQKNFFLIKILNKNVNVFITYFFFFSFIIHVCIYVYMYI